MTTYKVNFVYKSDDVISVNLCNGPSVEAVKEWYLANDKLVYSIHEASDGEIEEAMDKGMPWTIVPESYLVHMANQRIMSVLNDLIEIAYDEDNQILTDRCYKIIKAIAEEGF